MANGGYEFNSRLIEGDSYNVTATTQPAGETCVVSNGSGVVGPANVTNINVACTTTPQTTYTVGGNVTGFSSSSALTLTDGTDNLNVTASGGRSRLARPCSTRRPIR